jgi:acetate---CoA ligase (ADP-forming)
MRAADRHDTTMQDPTTQLLAPFARDVLIGSGRPVRVRPAGADDLDGLARFYRQLSDTSSYFRFFGVRAAIPEAELHRATQQDVSDHVTLVVDANGELIAVGEYFAGSDGEEAEVAFAVADAHHQEGIATILLEDLAGIAREAGFRRLVAQTLPDNVGMQRVFRDVGLVHRRWFEDGVVHVELDLTADDFVQDHADLGDWRGAVRSLQPLLRPRHVVVVLGGETARQGRRILEHLRASFDGAVGVAEPIAGRTGDGLDGLEGVPDLAVVAVPAPSVAAVVEQCGAAGVPTAVVVSAGFAEVGAGGAALQEQVLASARRHGMRLVGPNSLGVVSTSCGLNATFTSQRFRPGGIAIASQSGGVGIAIAAEAERRGAGISSFVSMGNKADVSGNDLLRLWADDDATRVVLLYLESFGDPVRFARIARAVAQRKPVVALKGGRSAPGMRITGSQPAAAEGDVNAVAALFDHTGVIRTRTMEELIDVGLLIDRQPLPRGRRIALVGNAGGPLILGADAADEAGAAVPVLGAELQQQLAELLPTAASWANPIDTGPSRSPGGIAAAVNTLAASREVDACVVVGVELEVGELDETLERLDSIAVDSLPIAVTTIGGGHRDVQRLPTFPTPERAATAMALACGHATRRSAIDAQAAEGVGIDAAPLIAARRLARQLAGDDVSPRWLGQPATFELLETAGVIVASWSAAHSAEECASAVRRLVRPCVVKADVGGIWSKSEVGAVRLGITDGDAAAAAYRDFERSFGERLAGVVVQSQVPGGVELFVGAVHDPAFGPFVAVGAGGVDAELRADRAVLVAPVTATEARSAVERLQVAPLFHGYRGRPALSIDAVVGLVTRVAALIAAAPEIEQLDLNPVIVGPSGCVVVDGRIALSARPSPVSPIRAMRGGTRGLP